MFQSLLIFFNVALSLAVAFLPHTITIITITKVCVPNAEELIFNYEGSLFHPWIYTLTTSSSQVLTDFWIKAHPVSLFPSSCDPKRLRKPLWLFPLHHHTNQSARTSESHGHPMSIHSHTRPQASLTGNLSDWWEGIRSIASNASPLPDYLTLFASALAPKNIRNTLVQIQWELGIDRIVVCDSHFPCWRDGTAAAIEDVATSFQMWSTYEEIIATWRSIF